jgi:hypothetical protein
MIYCLRLPPASYAEALQAGYKSRNRGLDLAQLGTGWVFGQYTEAELPWCIAAFDFAGKLVRV